MDEVLAVEVPGTDALAFFLEKNADGTESSSSFDHRPIYVWVGYRKRLVCIKVLLHFISSEVVKIYLELFLANATFGARGEKAKSRE